MLKVIFLPFDGLGSDRLNFGLESVVDVWIMSFVRRIGAQNLWLVEVKGVVMVRRK